MLSVYTTRQDITDIISVAEGKMSSLLKKRSTKAKPHPNLYNEYNGIIVQCILFPENVIVMSCFCNVFKNYKKNKKNHDYAFCQGFFISYNGVFSLHTEPDSLWSQQLSNSCQADS